MSAAAKMRDRSIAFKAPAFVLKEIRAKYASYIAEDEESVCARKKRPSTFRRMAFVYGRGDWI